jgi:chemotaxis response regulator CheB
MSRSQALFMAKTLWVVDDNESIRHALCEAFTSEAGFDVCGEAENGQQAIAKAKELHLDVIGRDLDARDERNRSRPCSERITACCALG